jgi:hypothetical protein
MTVNTIELQVKTVNLTKSLLKQIPVAGYDNLKNVLSSKNPGIVIGWVHGSVLGPDNDTWLIFKTSEGEYRRYNATIGMREKHKQIYII